MSDVPRISNSSAQSLCWKESALQQRGCVSANTPPHWIERNARVRARWRGHFQDRLGWSLPSSRTYGVWPERLAMEQPSLCPTPTRARRLAIARCQDDWKAAKTHRPRVPLPERSARTGFSIRFAAASSVLVGISKRLRGRSAAKVAFERERERERESELPRVPEPCASERARAPPAVCFVSNACVPSVPVRFFGTVVHSLIHSFLALACSRCSLVTVVPPSPESR